MLSVKEEERMDDNMEKVLVTGGLGFIGSHTVDLLIEESFDVVIIDNLDPQVHGKARNPPKYLNPSARFVMGDIRDRSTMAKHVYDSDAVLHLAAAVGVGQSMYEVSKYVDVNTKGTAVLLDVLVNEEHDVKKVVVASSMSIYGEGAFECVICGPVYPTVRSPKQLERKEWDWKCPNCKVPITPLPTPETKPLHPASIYAQTKRHQEEMCLLIGKTYGIPTVALRYFNTYGPRQSPLNPYTGVVAIFSSRLLNNKPPIVYEDGLQIRDFVHVQDVARANILALTRTSADYEPINIASGKYMTIHKLAETLPRIYEKYISPLYYNQYRAGDVRHCYANISKARKLLGYEPQVEIEEGMATLRDWMAKLETIEDHFDKAAEELKKKRLII